MAEFNRYVVTVKVVSGGADYTHTDEVSFSIAAVDKHTARSAIPLNHITHIHEYEIIEIKKQNE